LDDPKAEFPFSARLARDNGWSRDFALKVIEEYRRFCYLAMVAGHEVTPSDEVDLAWHLHMTYTRDYWGPFRKALGRPLHHGPTRGGKCDAARFEANYEATLWSYEKEFDTEPPKTIWQPCEVRFGKAPTYRRVSSTDFWMVPKRPVLAGAAVVTSIVFVWQAIISEALASTDDQTIFPATFSGWIVLAIAIGILIGMIVLADKRNNNKATPSCSGSACGSGCGSGCGGD
jgi:hypothetical protein